MTGRAQQAVVTRPLSAEGQGAGGIGQRSVRARSERWQRCPEPYLRCTDGKHDPYARIAYIRAQDRIGSGRLGEQTAFCIVPKIDRARLAANRRATASLSTARLDI